MRMMRPCFSSPTRRQLLGVAASFAALGLTHPAVALEPSFTAQCAAIEAQTGGRVGLAAIDTGSGETIGFRADERFAMCSTFKLLLAAQVLSRIDAGLLQPEQRVPVSAQDLVPYAPVVSTQLDQGSMRIDALCHAILTVSDNAAANLLLKQVGGPAGLTAYLRKLGDRTTRLDRIEPALNSNLPGDQRDTTTPAAMARTLQTLLTGPALSASSRAQLVDWMATSRTGVDRLRAGLPADWRAGGKTGSGAHGAVNDVAIVWPPGQPAWLVAVYTRSSQLPIAQLNAAHARLMEAVRRMFAGARN